MRSKLAAHERDQHRRLRLVATQRSDKLQKAIHEENARNPEWATINNAYAFEVGSVSVTVGFALHSFEKERTKGSSPLGVLLHLEQKEPEFAALTDALLDFFRVGKSQSAD